MIVTGASSGIGERLAIRAAEDGYAVVAVARRFERLQQLEATVVAAGGRIVTVTADVTANDAPARIVRAALDAFGRIDTVVHNAGTGAPGTLLEQTDAQIQRQLALHVFAPIRLSRAVYDHVLAARGILAFVGSGLARVPAPGFGAYNLAKAAIRSAAGQLRRELRGSGIAVCYIDPGAVDTEFSTASGMARTEGAQLGNADRVARAILRGLNRRKRIINAQPLQALGTAFAELFPVLADPIIDRVVDRPAESHAPAAPTPAPVEVLTRETTDRLGSVLEPLARRMERLNLTRAFIESLLVPGSTIAFNETAMRWAGMPNKNERAALREVFDLLASGGYLQQLDDERWSVVAGA